MEKILPQGSHEQSHRNDSAEIKPAHDDRIDDVMQQEPKLEPQKIERPQKSGCYERAKQKRRAEGNSPPADSPTVIERCKPDYREEDRKDDAEIAFGTNGHLAMRLNRLVGCHDSTDFFRFYFSDTEVYQLDATRFDPFRGPRIIAVAGNRGHLWGEQHRIETRTKRNHSRVNSEYLTLGGNYSRPPLYPFGNKLQFILEPINQSSNKLLMLGVGCRKKLQTPLKIIALLARFLGQLGLLAKVDSGFDYGVITSAQYK